MPRWFICFLVSLFV